MKEQFSSPGEYFDKVAATTGISSIDMHLVMRMFDLSPAQAKKALDDWVKSRRKSMEALSVRINRLSEGLLLSADEKAELVKKALKYIKTYCKDNGEEPTVNQVRSFLDQEESQLTADQAIDLANTAATAYRTQMTTAMRERVKKLSESVHKESAWTRYASTDEQEDSIKDVERWVSSAGKRIIGGTTIGKSPQTVILDLTHHGSEIYVNADGDIKVNDKPVRSESDFKRALETSQEAVRLLGRKKGSSGRYLPFTGDLNAAEPFQNINIIHSHLWWDDASFKADWPKIQKALSDEFDLKILRQKETEQVLGKHMKSRVNSLFEAVTPLGKISTAMKRWKAQGIKKDAAVQHALDEFGDAYEDDIHEVAVGLYEQVQIAPSHDHTHMDDKKMHPQSGEQEGCDELHDRIEALYASCMMMPVVAEQAAGKMSPQDRAPMNDTFGSNRESAKVDELIKHYKKHDLLEDRFEYSRDDLSLANPNLSTSEVSELYAKLQKMRTHGYKEHHFEKGEFPFDEFKIGWETEHKEHSTLHPIDIARLVLDHLKENEYYYTQPKTEKVTLAAEQILRDIIAQTPGLSPEQLTQQLVAKGIPTGDAADTVLRFSQLKQ